MIDDDRLIEQNDKIMDDANGGNENNLIEMLFNESVETERLPSPIYNIYSDVEDELESNTKVTESEQRNWVENNDLDNESINFDKSHEEKMTAASSIMCKY